MQGHAVQLQMTCRLSGHFHDVACRGEGHTDRRLVAGAQQVDQGIVVPPFTQRVASWLDAIRVRFESRYKFKAVRVFEHGCEQFQDIIVGGPGGDVKDLFAA